MAVSKRSGDERQLPRLPACLVPVEIPLGDDQSWDGVEVSAYAVVRSGAANCEVLGSRLSGVRFTGVELHRLRFIDVVLDDCELSGAVLSEATFTRVEFNRCRLSGLVASGLKARDVKWSDSKLDGANYRSATMERCTWRSCLLNEADFYASKISASYFDHCDLTNAEFSKAGCSRVNLGGSTLDGIKGATALGGCVIGSDQVVSLALRLFAAVGIVVDDDADHG